jgi:Bacterial Ig-like domain
LTQPTFAYESDDPDATFECRFDEAPFEPCNLVEEEPPEELSEGRHVFVVRAVDPSGKVDPTPARSAFRIDAEPPIAEFLRGPFRVTHQRRPKFTIRVSGQSSFWCLLHGGGVRIKVRSCDGPHSFRPPHPLPNGDYEVAVLAFDRAGNETENFGYFTVSGVARRGEVP